MASLHVFILVLRWRLLLCFEGLISSVKAFTRIWTSAFISIRSVVVLNYNRPFSVVRENGNNVVLAVNVDILASEHVFSVAMVFVDVLSVAQDGVCTRATIALKWRLLLF